MTISSITPEELVNMQAESSALTLIDVREPAEFAALRSSFGVNIPLSRIEAEGVSSVDDAMRNSTVYLICRSGKRSLRAAQVLAAGGLAHVVNVTGGMTAWEASGLPVVRS